MGLGDKLSDTSYRPQDKNSDDILSRYVNIGAGKCPVRFTEDPIEYCESKEYLGVTLRPIQKQFIEDLYSLNDKGKPNFSEGVLISGMRCLGLGTTILMYDGSIKNIENIVIGDKVMGPDSRPRRVLDTNKGVSDLYEITQSCAMSYVVNESHILSLKKSTSVSCCVNKKYAKGVRKSYERYQEYPNIVNIPINDYISKSEKWKYFFRGYTAGIIEYPHRPVPIDPYLFSTWLGDGDSAHLAITSMDREIYTYWRDQAVIHKLLFKASVIPNSKANRYSIQGIKPACNVLWDSFKNMNLKNNKHVPEVYISNSVEVRLQVLAGFIDTDGSVHKHGYEISQVNTRTIFAIKQIADSLGFRTYIREKKTTCQVPGFVGKAWRLTIHGDVWKIPVRVERKKYVHNGKHSNKENGLSSIKVKHIGKGPFAGIAVDKDSLYCLSDCTVVHNSGKSVCAGIIATFQTQKLLAMDDPAAELGQLTKDRLTVQCIASSLEQAGETIYAKVEALVNGSTWWVKYIEWLQKRELAPGGKGTGSLYGRFSNHIEFFEKNVGILALHANSASLAGKTSACCVFDELSRFDVAEGNVQQKSQKRTAQAVYNTSARAATSLLPFSKVVTITSPMYEDDYGMQLLVKAGTFKGGKHSGIIEALRTKEPIKAKNMLGYHFTTFEVNPRFKDDGTEIMGGCSEEDDFFISKKLQDPEAYRRDYLAIPPSAISPFIEYPERILSCLRKDDDPKVMFSDKIIEDTADLNGQLITRRYIAKDVLVTHPDRMTKYYVCCDQGLSRDSFVVAMGHGEEFKKKEIDSTGREREFPAYKIVVDFVEQWVPDKQNRLTVNFKNVEDVIIVLTKAFNICSVAYDQWNSASSIQTLFSHGIFTERLGATLEMYEVLKQMIYTSLIILPDDPTLIKEIRQLNLIKNVRIDHSYGQSKDSSDAVVRVVYKLYTAYIKDAYQGNYMMPQGQRFPTIRSIASEYDMLNSEMQNGGGRSVFGGNFGGGSGSSSSIFDGNIVRPNVVPNISGK